MPWNKTDSPVSLMISLPSATGWKTVMNAEQLFWMVNEFIKDKLEDMSASDRQNLMDKLEQDTDDTVLTFDLF